MLEFETGATMKDSWARPCDACRSAASSVYCRADLAYLCTPCDARIHIHPASLHDRVWVCESCERAPAAFLCKADSASLCAACDANIHSANPLARRHHRVPVQPIPTTLYCPSAGGHMIRPEDEMLTPEAADDDEDEAASWLLLNPMKNGDDEARPPSFAGEFDEYLDLDDYSQFSEGYSCNNHHHYQQQQQQHYGVPQSQSSYGGDSIVPIKYEKGNNNSSNCSQLGYSTYPPSITQTVSISSMDVGIVPESAASEAEAYDTSASLRAPKGTIDVFSSTVIEGAPSQLSAMDREARVMRYREKKKTRKFEKTIRYASRKAYAETRPRIKGRFAKRRGSATTAQLQVDDQIIFSSQSLMPSDAAYGVVPSF